VDASDEEEKEAGGEEVNEESTLRIGERVLQVVRDGDGRFALGPITSQPISRHSLGWREGGGEVGRVGSGGRRGGK